MAKPSAEATSYNAVMPYLCVKGAADAITFYKKAFGAKELYRLKMGDKVGHAELDIGGAVVMLSDEFPEMGAKGPKALGGSPVTLAVMVANTDATLKKAVAAGAKVKRPATNEFYGYRSAQIEDPFGHVWMIQQMIEEVPPKEMQQRLDDMLSQPRSAAAKKVARKLSRKSKS